MADNFFKLEPELRSDLIIAPGPTTISAGASATDLVGKFKGSAPAPVDVYLGTLDTDPSGRLLFIPGHGNSRCILDPADPHPLLLTDFDNPNWVDDTCDGTVKVTVKPLGETSMYVDIF